MSHFLLPLTLLPLFLSLIHSHIYYRHTYPQASISFWPSFLRPLSHSLYALSLCLSLSIHTLVPVDLFISHAAHTYGRTWTHASTARVDSADRRISASATPITPSTYLTALSPTAAAGWPGALGGGGSSCTGSPLAKVAFIHGLTAKMLRVIVRLPAPSGTHQNTRTKFQKKQ